MAATRTLALTFLFTVLFVQHILCADPPMSSTSPAPESGDEAFPPPPFADPLDSPSHSPSLSPSPSPSPSPSDSISSPPSPLSSDLAPSSIPPASSSAPLPPNSTALAPSPVVSSDVSHDMTASWQDSSSDGMNGEQKAGIVIGVIVAACVVGLGAMVYRKRQQNIQWSRYMHAGRREVL